MKNKFLIIIIAVVIIVVLSIGLTNNVLSSLFRLRFFPTEQQKRVLKKFAGLIIKNDVSDGVAAEFMEDGKLIIQENVEMDNIIADAQGKVRIFVPEKKGWYTVEYEYPYPLTQKTPFFFVGPYAVYVNLSSLINSIQSGEVEYSRERLDENSEKDVARDIKVTFESGELEEEVRED